MLRGRTPTRSPTSSAGGAWLPARRASSRPTGSARSRRHANSSARADAVSSHCTSSTATRTGRSRASRRSSPSSATPSARSSGGAALGGSSSSATRSASACGRGSSPIASCGDPSRRSPSPAKASCASASAGRAWSTTPAAPLRLLDAGQPQRRLADPGLALEQQRRRAGRPVLGERGERGELALSPHDAGCGPGGHAGLPRRTGSARSERERIRGRGTFRSRSAS